ncbi:MAG: iron-sulfur cluster repair di-iron protein [Saprospiraceae bacterium]|nr:iron-sulfur cluster repair di-iron protein [Saprospiraceae bacterium]MBK7523771.1 iron-sulfur cluster repair di-iron protein [Saprospiraceae bacterium]MBK8373286.1 iron-sulfur cluster repair di-iron protein [Saprospiraceae bacterium]MBK8820432.1 iron-sulfur cluster repair di-iron protein [Saprospiraceae bacterium]MBK9045056.1 iron-sulfur cluster repair di-iron protein [Saprospiraceae bacterium]
MNIDIHAVIGEIVADNYKTAEVFRSYGIDFCCKGNRTLNDLKNADQITLDQLIRDLNLVRQDHNDFGVDYNTWPLDLLADFIEKKYHRYIEEKLPVINEYLVKVCKVHGHAYPELYKIYEVFRASSEDLLHHMKKEENILFPHIRKMVLDAKMGLPYQQPMFGFLKNPIAMMEDEHTIEGDRYREISTLTNNYTPPPNACNTFVVTYAMLHEFEEKLHEHIHLENNILFPKAIKEEENLKHKLN